MKKISKSLLALLFVTVVALSLTACGKEAESSELSNPNTTKSTQTSENDSVGIWENALYLEDTELGQGSKNVVVEVKVENRSVIFNIHTDKATVGEALFENGLIAGDEGEYGLYVKIVNGITADYDIDQSYWAFYIDGEYATAGVDGTDINEESVYKLEYTK